MQYTAHIRVTDQTVQTVGEHCRNTSVLAGKYLESIGLRNVGKLVGLLHDAGKLTNEFDDYIHRISSAARGSIDHSYAGARYLTELGDNSDIKQSTAATGMAHTILSHHSIHDWVDENGRDYFGERISKNENYNEVLCNISEITDGMDIGALFENAVKEWFSAASEIKTTDKTEFSFYLGMLERLIQSALIDADRTDTANFMSAVASSPETECKDLWAEMDRRMNDKLKDFEKYTDIISIQRRSISDRCAAFAEHKVGACRLIVPTGGGKTLTSLRFAIKQCRKFGMKRVYYIAPFMSILEQNSAIIRELAGDKNFLEHHSNIASDIDDENEYNAYQLSAERWDRPVIATTMVQFLNTLFSGKTSSIRRMHRLCRSVIIIDEVQSVPLRCTDLFSLAVNFLTKVCGSTVVLCSATQPTFERNEHRLILDAKPDIIQDYSEDFKAFQRTQVISAIKKYGYDFEEATDLCIDKLRENGNLLFVVNTKAQAVRMYELMKEKLSCEAFLIHLSTNMCPAHRIESMNKLKHFLKCELPVICITTQLIEAGVDISFKCVVRALAGLDNAAQAAGRCNRNGEYDYQCPVYLINFKSESLGSLEEIKQAQNISRNMLDRNCFDDILSVSAQSEFFRQLFDINKAKLSYPIDDNNTLLDLLSLNRSRWEIKKETFWELSQAFKTAGKMFEVIDNNTEGIIVPYDKEAHKIIDKLIGCELTPAQLMKLLRKAQKYTVNIYEGAKRKLFDSGAIYTCKNGVSVLDERFYSDELGVNVEGAEKQLLIY